jgi:hypothetical protein
MTSRKGVNETWTGIDIGMLAALSICILYEWAHHIRFALAYWPAIPVSARRELLVFGVLYGVPWIAYCVQAIRNKWSFTYALPLMFMYILLLGDLDSFTTVIRQCCQAIGR